MAKKNESVSQLVRKISDDSEFRDRVDKELHAKRMGKILFALRCHRGYSQAELAERINCSQSRISKIEHSYDDNLTLGDLTAYTEALDIALTVSFHRDMNATESVKYHALQIKRRLDDLRKLAAGDATMLDGVAKFYQEFIMNIVAIFGSCAAQLPPEHRNRVLQITAEPELMGMVEGQENETVS